MLTSTAVRPRVAARPKSASAFRVFTVRVVRTEQLTPTFLRVTFTGDDLDEMHALCLDRRIKLVFPLEGIGLSGLDTGPDWYSAWRSLPDERRNPLRTYTTRAVRPEVAELDVDFVCHGIDGPAAAWVHSARPGDEIAIVGPDAGFEHNDIGIEWRPGGATTVLLAGDETAAPAICSILSALPDSASGHAFIEVPASDDAMDVHAPANVQVTWLGRDGSEHGSKLAPALKSWVRSALPAASETPVDLDDIDLDTDIMWEAPAEIDGRSLYAWLAGEANVIKSLRRFLVQESGVDRSQVAFMGYWRLGHTERN